MGFDMSKVECYNYHMKGHFARECRSPKDTRRNSATEPQRRNVQVETSTSNALVFQCDGVGSYDWSFQAEEEPTNYALMAFTSSISSSDNESDESLPPSLIYDRYQSRDGYHAVPPPYTGTFMPPKPELVFHDAPNVNETAHTAFNVELNPAKPDTNLPSVKTIETSIPTAKTMTTIPKPKSNGTRRNRKACFVCKSLDHLIKDSVLTQSKLVPITAARPVIVDVPNSYVTRPRLATPVVTNPHSPPRRYINRSLSPRASNFPPKVTAAKAPMVNAVKGDKGVIDNGCSRHMTGNMSYLSNFKELNGRYVAFGGNPKCGKIYGKGKFDEKIDEGFLVGYSVSSKAFRVFNSRTRIVQETLHINFLENKPNVAGSGPTWLFDIDTLKKTMNYQPVTAGNQSNPSAGVQEQFDAEKKPEFEGEKPESEVHVSPSSSAQTKKHDEKTKREAKGKSHVETLIGYRNLKLKDITYSNDEEDVGVKADFTNLETTITVSHIPTNRVHKDHPVTQIIGDLSSATQTRSMIRVANDQGGATSIQEQKEDGINYEEVFASVARIEAIRLFLAYASFMGFMVYQMDVQSIFLYETIEEEVYICQPPGFDDPDYPDKVYKVVKALYGLYQAPRAWYKTLANYLLENGFQRGKIDQTLFIKIQKGDILLIQIYVDDIIFGFTNKELCKDFEKLMKDKFQMSSIGELTFFLGLKVNQKPDGIFIRQDKYVAEILRKFGLTDALSVSTPIDTENPLLKDPDGDDVDHVWISITPKALHLHAVKRIFRYLKGKPHLGLWYPKDSPFNLVAYSDSDYAGASLDRKKQTVVATSSTEAEYVAAQWKFLIHTILQCMSAKRTSWNKFSSSMASAVICLSTGRNFNFSKYIFDSLVRNVDSSTKFYMYPRFLQLMIRTQVGDLSLHTTKYSSPALTQKVFANIRRVRKGCSGVETPLFEGMIVAPQAGEGVAEGNVDDVPAAGVAIEGTASVNVDDVLAAVDEPSIPSSTPPTQPPPPSQDIPYTSQKLERRNKLKVSKLRRLKKVGTSQRVDTSDDTVMDDVSKQGRIIVDMDVDVDVALKDVTDIAKEVAADAAIKKRPAEFQEVVEVVTTAMLITKVVTAANASEGFDQIIDFLNASSIKYALTVNPNIYVSCIKQFWTSISVKKVHDVTRLQALVDKKKVIITEATIRDALRLDDAEGIDCLANEEIFAETQVGDLSLHTTKYSSPALTQKVFANMRRGRIIADMDADVDVALKDVTDIAKEVAADAEIKKKPAELQEVVEVVTTAMLINKVVTAASATITSKSKDKGKGILVEEPKPLKKQAQIEQDEAYARELEAEQNKNIDWDKVIDQVQRKEKEDNDVMRYQALKKKPQTEAQARKNMMIYLRNMVGFKIDYFKGIKYDDIRLIFEKYFNSNRSSERNTKPPSWLSDYYTKISKSTFETKTSEGGNHLEEGESSMKCNRPLKKRKIVKGTSWNEVYDRDNKIVRFAEEMGIPPKGTDGEYDAKVLERIRNYVQNEPINLIPGCPLDNADVDQSGPSQVPAPLQNIPLVPVPLLPAAMLFPTTTPDLLQILPPPTVSETTSSQTMRITRNQPYPQRFKDYLY
nr:putative ribonuclease H-like domain-containing protein [Tanacetum cinerariifolium]